MLLHGCEVWAHEGTGILEKKYTLGIVNFYCTNMVYAGLGSSTSVLVLTCT